MSSCQVVLVAGGTASGKTTIVAEAVAATGAVHIAHDRYYLDAPDPSRNNFDHPSSLETSLLVSHVAALKRGEVVELPRYGFPNHRLAQRAVCPDPKVLLPVYLDRCADRRFAPTASSCAERRFAST